MTQTRTALSNPGAFLIITRDDGTVIAVRGNFLEVVR